jgi:PAS domain S-box-containing protein
MPGDSGEQLFASASRMRELVEQLPVVVYVDSDDPDPLCAYVSPNVERLIGLRPDRVIADPTLSWELIHPDDRSRVREEYARAWSNGSPFRSEYRVVRPDGREVWVRDSAVLVLAEDGTRLAWQGVMEDITTEKRAGQDMRASEARYRAIVERIPAVVYEMGPDDERRTVYVSSHVEEVFGYSRAEWLDQPDIWIELLHADDREIVLDRHDRYTRTGEPWDLEYRLIASDGRVVWVHDRGTLIRDLEGRPSAWHGVMLDVTAEHEAREMLRITNEELERRVAERTAALEEANELMSLEIGERRRMEAEVTEARKRFQGLVENLPGVAYLWEASPDATTRTFAYLSPQIEEMVGFSPDEWDADARLHPHDVGDVSAAVAKSARTGEPLRIECRYLAKDGRVVWVLEHASLIARSADGEPQLFQGVMLDLTPRKEAETKAAEAEDRFRALTERGPVVAFTYELGYDAEAWPPSVRITYLSPHVGEVIGEDPSTYRHDPDRWLGMIHPDDRERALATIHRSWGSGEDWSVRYRMIRGDGAVIWLQSLGRMLERDGSGRPWRFQGVLLDVTAEQEETVRSQRLAAEQRAALDGAMAIPWTETIDPSTGFERYTFIGAQSIEVLGYTPEELMVEREHFPRMVHPDDLARMRESLARAARTGVWEDEYRVIRRDGGIRWLRSFGRRVTAERETPEIWQGVAIDVTPSRAEPDDARWAGGAARERSA